jgi:small-conductance mechanosensitive channel
VLKTPAPSVEVDGLGPISTTLTVRAWVENHDFLATLSDVKKRVRQALQGAEINAPVPVAPPSVAPWTPPAEQMRESKKPN